MVRFSFWFMLMMFNLLNGNLRVIRENTEAVVVASKEIRMPDEVRI